MYGPFRVELLSTENGDEYSALVVQLTHKSLVCFLKFNPSFQRSGGILLCTCSSVRHKAFQIYKWRTLGLTDQKVGRDVSVSDIFGLHT